MIDLVAGLFDLSPYEAARKIAADFGIDPNNPPEAAALAKLRHPMVKAALSFGASGPGGYPDTAGIPGVLPASYDQGSEDAPADWQGLRVLFAYAHW